MSEKARRFGRLRAMDVVVLLVVVAAFAVGAHVLGFGPLSDSRAPAQRVDADVEVHRDAFARIRAAFEHDPELVVERRYPA